MDTLDLLDIGWRGALYGLLLYLANRLLGGWLLQAVGPGHARAVHLGLYGLVLAGYGAWGARRLGRGALGWAAGFAVLGLALGW